MNLRRVTDWTILPGASVEIRHQGPHICTGHVDAVTDDGKIPWPWAVVQGPRLFELTELHKAWAAEA